MNVEMTSSFDPKVDSFRVRLEQYVAERKNKTRKDLDVILNTYLLLLADEEYPKIKSKKLAPVIESMRECLHDLSIPVNHIKDVIQDILFTPFEDVMTKKYFDIDEAQQYSLAEVEKDLQYTRNFLLRKFKGRFTPQLLNSIEKNFVADFHRYGGRLKPDSDPFLDAFKTIVYVRYIKENPEE